MGVVRCKLHGLSGFRLVCSHVHDALASQRTQEVAVVVDEHAAIAMVCMQCIGAFTNAVQTGEGISVGFNGGTENNLGPMCPVCFDAWVGPDRVATLRRTYVDAVAIFDAQITGPLRAVGLLRELEPTASAPLPSLHDVRGKLSKDVAAAVVAYLQRRTSAHDHSFSPSTRNLSDLALGYIDCERRARTSGSPKYSSAIAPSTECGGGAAKRRRAG